MTTIDQTTDQTGAAAPAATVQPVGLLRRLQLTEPVRLYLYGVVLAVLAVLVPYGIVSGTDAAIWAGLAAAVLAVPTAELTRRQTVSQRTNLQQVVQAARNGVA